MNKYIKYERFEKDCHTLNDIQDLFNYLIENGYEIVKYDEIQKSTTATSYYHKVIIVAGKLKTIL